MGGACVYMGESLEIASVIGHLTLRDNGDNMENDNGRRWDWWAVKDLARIMPRAEMPTDGLGGGDQWRHDFAACPLVMGAEDLPDGLVEGSDYTFDATHLPFDVVGMAGRAGEGGAVKYALYVWRSQDGQSLCAIRLTQQPGGRGTEIYGAVYDPSDFAGAKKGRVFALTDVKDPTRRAGLAEWLQANGSQVAAEMRGEVASTVYRLNERHGHPVLVRNDSPKVTRQSKTGRKKPWMRDDGETIIFVDSAIHLREQLGVKGSSSSPCPHRRRGHWATLRHERYGNNRGKRVWIREAWVGPKEMAHQGKTYRLVVR